MTYADRAELEQWLSHRNAEAFHAIVARHAGMVYATCRRIVRNAADAEEIAQECFEALVQAERLPRTAYLGAWLHGVATNRSLDRVRREARRANREARYAREQPAAHTPDWDDIYEFVDEALAELPEECRNPIVAHYLEGRTHREIAEALGIPRRTVTNRIARGLDLLSDALRRRGVPMASAALAALLATHAVAEAVPPSLAASLGKLALAQGNAATGAAVAGTGFAIKALVAVVLATAGVGWWWNSAPVGPELPEAALAVAETAQTPSIVETPGVAETPPTNSVPSGTSNVQPSPAPETGEGWLFCEVVRGDGAPVPNAEVRLSRVAGRFAMHPPGTVERNGRTNARGELLFEGLPKDTYAIMARDGSEVGVSIEGAQCYRRERIVLAPADVLRGTVRTSVGEPVPNAKLSVADVEPKSEYGNRIVGFVLATTDPAGAFQLELPRTFRWKVRAVAEGQPLLVSDTLRPQADNDLVFAPSRTIDGVVTLPDTGEPVAGAPLVFSATDMEFDRHATVTDAGGRFTVAGLRDGRYGVRVEVAGFAIAETSRVVTVGADASTTLNVALVPAASIAGVVTESTSGEPLADVPVSLRSEPRDREMRDETTTDAEGHYAFVGLSPGTYRVSVRETDGYGGETADRRQDVEVVAGEDRPDVDFGLTDTYGVSGIVTGRARDVSGRPVRHAVVYSKSVSSMIWVVSVPVDAQGAFRMRHPVTRELRLLVYGPNIAAAETAPMILPPEGIDGIEIVAGRAGSISGRFVTTSKRPFDIEDTYIDTSSWHYRGFCWTACRPFPNGGFRLPDLPPGEHRLTLDLPAYRYNTGIRRADAIVTLADGEDVTGIEIPFDDVSYNRSAARQDDESEAYRQQEEARKQRTWEVNGRVFAADTGRPIASYGIKTPNQRMEINDDAGRFSVNCGESPSVELEILAFGYAPYRETVLQSQAVDRVASVEFRLQPSPIVEGIVVDETGKPINGARIFPGEIADDIEMLQARYPVTGPEGTFRLDSVEVTTQRIYAEHPSYAFGWVELTPRRGANRITITLTHGGRIEGAVTIGGTPAQGVRVGYYPEDFGRRQFSVTTDADGRFTIENLVPGMVRVSAFPPTSSTDGLPSRWRSEEVHVDEGQTTALTIAMGGATSRIEGAITYQGEPAPFTFVRPALKTAQASERLEAKYENGIYRTDPIPAGEITLSFELVLPSQVRLRQDRVVHVGENEVVQLDVDFPGRGVVEGSITGMLPGEHVVVAAFEGEQPLPESVERPDELLTGNIANSNAKDGAYMLEGLEPGTYTIRAVSLNALDDAPRAAYAIVTLAGDERIPVDFTLE